MCVIAVVHCELLHRAGVALGHDQVQLRHALYRVFFLAYTEAWGCEALARTHRELPEDELPACKSSSCWAPPDTATTHSRVEYAHARFDLKFLTR